MCSQCGKGFASSGDYRRHQRSQSHNGIPAGSLKQPRQQKLKPISPLVLETLPTDVTASVSQALQTIETHETAHMTNLMLAGELEVQEKFLEAVISDNATSDPNAQFI